MITFVCRRQHAGANLVQFCIGGQHYVYRLSFPEWCWVAERIAHYSPGRALNWVKKKASAYYLVESQWPFTIRPPKQKTNKEKVEEQLELSLTY